MIRKHGWRLDRALHNYVYFVFYYPYVKTIFKVLPALKYFRGFKPIVPLGKMIFDRYHSKVLSLEDTRKIFKINKDINLTSDQNKNIIPFKYARNIIFQEPEFIAVMDCPCKKAANAQDSTVSSCIAVGKQLASFWLDHCSKYNPRKISQEQALEIVTTLRNKGHITQAFFKVATGGCTGVICNCHPETCASLQATMYARQIDIGLSMNAPSGYSVTHDPKKCSKCKACESICHFDALCFTNGNRKYSKDLCMGCGLCIENCPETALSMVIDPDKPYPLDIDMIMENQEKI